MARPRRRFEFHVDKTQFLNNHYIEIIKVQDDHFVRIIYEPKDSEFIKDRVVFITSLECLKKIAEWVDGSDEFSLRGKSKAKKNKALRSTL